MPVDVLPSGQGPHPDAPRPEERVSKPVPATGGGHEALERLLAYALLALGVAVVLAMHWPGRLNSDSTATIGQMEGGSIGDHRSAVATWIWRQAYLLIDAGPDVVLLVQTAALAIGCYLVLRSVYGRLAAAALGAAVLFAPPTFGFVGLVGRDMWFVASCVLAVGIAVTVVRVAARGRAWSAIAWLALGGGAVLATLAVAVRQNGASAVLPIMAALAAGVLLLAVRAGRAPRRLRTHPLLAATLGGLAATLLAVAVAFAGTAVIRTHQEYPQIYTQLWDLGHITHERGERVIPELPRNMLPVQTVAEVEERWRPTTSLFMRWSLDYQTGSTPFTAEPAARLDQAWRSAIRAHPLTYLEGRFELWVSQLGVGFTPGYTVVTGVQENPYGIEGPRWERLSDLALAWASLWVAYKGTQLGGFLHHAWIYLLICMVGLLLLLPRFARPVRVVGALAAAGIGAQVGLFLLAPSVQWRYQLLTAYAAVLVALVSAALLARAVRVRWGADRRAAATSSPAG